MWMKTQKWNKPDIRAAATLGTTTPLTHRSNFGHQIKTTSVLGHLDGDMQL
jgi:hypothetical protein